MPGRPPPPQTFAASIAEAIRSLFGAGYVWVRGFSESHKGLDLAAVTGTPIRAASDGVVSYAQNEAQDASAPWYTRGGGNVVAIKIGGLTTEYAHLSRIDVRPGQVIHKGDVIGLVGMTGGPNQYIRNIEAPTGPHLHFAVVDNATNAFIDPLPFVKAGKIGDPLPGFGNLVNFPDGTPLTPAMVEQIVQAMQNAGLFSSQGPFAEILSRNKVRDILMSHVGEPWGKPLQDKLQTEIFGAADAAADTPLRSVGEFFLSLGSIFDPGFWIRVLALLVGMALTAYGGVSLLRASA